MATGPGRRKWLAAPCPWQRPIPATQGCPIGLLAGHRPRSPGVAHTRSWAAPATSTLGLVPAPSRRCPGKETMVEYGWVMFELLPASKGAFDIFWNMSFFFRPVFSIIQMTFWGCCNSPRYLWWRCRWCCRWCGRSWWCKRQRQLVVVQRGQLALLGWNCGSSPLSYPSSLLGGATKIGWPIWAW